MKVPTYHKYGLTKAKIEKSELRDKKISDILTHHLTIGIGVVLGILVYILNYSEVQPSTFIQAVMQVFLFASMGIICVGVPAVLFKLAEMFYFKYISQKTKEKQNIKKYYEDREEFDFWKIRTDFSFWRVLDGFSFEKEVMNIFMHMGYEIDKDAFSEEHLNDRIVAHEDKNYYISFNTGKEIQEINVIENLLKLKNEKGCEQLKVFSQKGFGKKVKDYGKEKDIELYDINGLVKIVRSIRGK